jgi:hypothetical protein
MPKGQYQRRPVNPTPVDLPAPDPAPAQAAVEQAEVAIAEAEQKVEELSLVDVNDCLKVGDFVGKGNRQISNTYGEFLVDPETGKVTKCL